MEIMDIILDAAGGYLLGRIWGMIEFVCRFLLYPFFAFALYKLAVREELENPILAIIPVYNMTYIVKIIKCLHVFGKKISGLALSVLLVACALLRNPFIDKIPLIGNIAEFISVVFLFFYLLSLHRLWEMYIPKSADSFLVLATLFPVCIPFLMFFIRDKQQVSSQMLLDYNSDGIIDEVVTVHNAAPSPIQNAQADNVLLKQDLSTYWLKECPLLITRQEFVERKNTNTVFLNLTIQNISQHTIKAIFMEMACYDYLQNVLQDVPDCKLMDINVEANGIYRTNMNISLPDKDTRKCKIIVKDIVFANDEIWHNENNTPLERTLSLEMIQFKPELMKFMADKLKGEKIPNGRYLFRPAATEDYWFCGCGQFNTSDNSSCCHCHIDRNKVFEIINEENLQRDYALMIEGKVQHNLEVKEQYQQMFLEQKEKLGNQISKGKDKLENLWKKK